MKKLIYLIVLALILGLVLTGCLLSNVGQVPTSEQSGITYLTKGTEAEPDEFPLYAGQDMLVGNVLVWDDGEELCVKYQLSDDAILAGWLLYETHWAVGVTESTEPEDIDVSDIPQTKKGNPIPGQFLYGEDDLPGVDSREYCIPFDELGVEELGDLTVKCGDSLVIVAHAVIEKTECGDLTEAPYGGFQVVDSSQGLRRNYTPVRTERSNPDAVLTFEVGHNEIYFFSLGFQEDRPENLPADNAWIIVEFDTPIQNGPGDDLQVIEDTWGLPYPDETAAVSVSQDNINWFYLGEADNQTPLSKYHTISDFDLDGTGLDWVKYVKVQDTSNRADFPTRADADGYDLNAIVALQDYQECTAYNESAWGAVSQGNEQFDGANWATYFTYDIEPETLEIGDSYGGGIVAYILQGGDPGYDANEQHGLIAATADQSTGRQWFNDGIYEETGTTGTAIGTGQANTTAIVEKQGVGSYAAQLCNELTEGGYNDWFLPSKDELNKLYLNKVEIGGFAVYDDWWSSSEGGANYAWSQNFSTGYQTNFYKYAGFWVRAVRAF